MTPVTALQKALDDAINPVDRDAARERLVAAMELEPAGNHPVAEHLYRLGVTTLMRKRDLAAAMELFKRGAEKKDPLWSPNCRTSYALTLHAKGKHQQAVFELRKVTGLKEPLAACATAFVFLCQVQREMGAKPLEIEKSDKERIAALEAHLRTVGVEEREERAHWLVLLAAAHKEGGSRKEARRLLQEVVAWGPAAGEPSLRTAVQLLVGM